MHRYQPTHPGLLLCIIRPLPTISLLAAFILEWKVLVCWGRMHEKLPRLEQRELWDKAVNYRGASGLHLLPRGWQEFLSQQEEMLAGSNRAAWDLPCLARPRSQSHSRRWYPGTQREIRGHRPWCTGKRVFVPCLLQRPCVLGAHSAGWSWGEKRA